MVISKIFLTENCLEELNSLISCVWRDRKSNVLLNVKVLLLGKTSPLLSFYSVSMPLLIQPDIKFGSFKHMSIAVELSYTVNLCTCMSTCRRKYATKLKFSEDTKLYDRHQDVSTLEPNHYRRSSLHGQRLEVVVKIVLVRLEELITSNCCGLNSSINRAAWP